MLQIKKISLPILAGVFCFSTIIAQTKIDGYVCNPLGRKRYLPEIKAGDKRIIVIDGEPLPYALARIPKIGETRGNLAAGGTGVAQPLTKRDREIAEAVGAALKQIGLFLVGLDVIGERLTEINVTSPTGIRELKKYGGADLAAKFLDVVEQRVRSL